MCTSPTQIKGASTYSLFSNQMQQKKKDRMQVLCVPSSLSNRNRKIFDHEIYADIIYTRQETSPRKKLIKKKNKKGGC